MYGMYVSRHTYIRLSLDVMSMYIHTTYVHAQGYGMTCSRIMSSAFSFDVALISCSDDSFSESDCSPLSP